MKGGPMALHLQVAYSGITLGDEICDLLATALAGCLMIQWPNLTVT